MATMHSKAKICILRTVEDVKVVFQLTTVLGIEGI